ncbi:MAG: aspartate--ammonia ligase [Clostridia bacterium]|nr:aspartate--ammonia ligase [Clostridia bacterium]
MPKTVIPDGYKPKLSIYDTQRAIDYIKIVFSSCLRSALDLKRVSAPLFVTRGSGLNDNLNGVERPVEFDVPAVGEDAQIVHSLAKWKRLALARYGFPVGVGLYADMNAVRRDEELDNIHSIYVDQWDWEKVISKEQRNVGYLKETVNLIVKALCETNDAVKERFPALDCEICPDVTFVTSQELEDMYPALDSHGREDAFVKEYKTTFIMKIGGKLNSGKPHDGRAPDYDDWELNGDILLWNDVLGRSFEISSMGIRVDAESLERQLELAGCPERRELEFHRLLLEGKLPLTMGGGIGQSRMCMLMMQTAHIGEVQASIWDETTRTECEKAGAILL